MANVVMSVASSSSVPPPSSSAAMDSQNQLIIMTDFTSIHPAFPIPDRAKLQYQAVDPKPAPKPKKTVTAVSAEPPEELAAAPIRYLPLSFHFEREWSSSDDGSENDQPPKQKHQLVMQVIKAELTGIEMGTKYNQVPVDQPRAVYCIFEYWLSPSIARETQAADYQYQVARNASRQRKHRLAFGLRWFDVHEIADQFTKRFQDLTGVKPSKSVLGKSPLNVAATREEKQFHPRWAEEYAMNEEELVEAGQTVSIIPRPAFAPRTISRKPAAAVAAAASSSSTSPPAAVSVSEPLPSFPLPFQGDEDADSESARTPILLRELELCSMSAIIREKPDWHNKILNPLIRLRWRIEAQIQNPALSTKALMYMMQELDYLAEIKRRALASPSSVSYDPAPIDGVWQSDQAIGTDLIQSILQEIKVLEDIPEAEKDYHPGSNNQVIDLVHPSLYCVRYGRTRRTRVEFPLRDCFAQATDILPTHLGTRSPKSKPDPQTPQAKWKQERRAADGHPSPGYTISDHFCWMPAEFAVAATGKVRIRSYINNLHPKKHEKLYHLLEKTFERVLPMLERVLTFVTVGRGMDLDDGYRMKGGYFYDNDAPLDSIEERFAIAAAKNQEAQSIVMASKNPQLANEKTDNHDMAPPAITYLTTFRPSPVPALQRHNTLQVLEQIHPGLKIDSRAMNWLTTLQDCLAHMILHECCGPLAPKTAAEFNMRRDNRHKKQEENSKKWEREKAEAKMQKNETVADQVGAASLVSLAGAAGASSTAAPASATPLKPAASSSELSVDWSFLEGIEPFFHASIEAGIGDLYKHAYVDARKYVTSYLSTGKSGVTFRNALARRWYDDFKSNLPSDAASAVKPSLTHVQQLSLSTLVEYLSAEILELGGNCALDSRAETILEKHFKYASDHDRELKVLFGEVLNAFTAADVRELLQKAEAAAGAAVSQDDAVNEQGVLEPTSGGDSVSNILTQDQQEEAKQKEKAELKAAIQAEDAADEIARLLIVGDKATEESSKNKSKPKRGAKREDDEDQGEGVLRFGDVVFPYPRPIPFESLPASSKVDLRGRRLQVIVKFANIVLTPANPKYKGGSFHVEGMENESIVASSIVYLHSENISVSRLSFRHSCRFYNPDQDDTRGPSNAWGLQRDGGLNQSIGAVITKAGRAIAFPNVYQHVVMPFELIDKSKIGLRKILVFFLVDPNKRIPSSSTIPPQNFHWVEEYFSQEVQPLILEETPLIPDLIDLVRDYILGPKENNPNLHFTNLDGAKKDREYLMQERKYFVEQNSQIIFEREFAFCEH